ncbi:MAG: CPBP family intramembrane glutamic endopeptidase [Bacilli bacterium]
MVAYVLMTCIVNLGLSHDLSVFHIDAAAVSWNIASAILICCVIVFATKFTSAARSVKLKTDGVSLLLMVFGTAVYALIAYVIWTNEAGLIHFLFHLLEDFTGGRIRTHSTIIQKLVNAIFGLVIAILVFLFSLWRLKSWRGTLYSMKGTDIQIVLLVILLSTLISISRNAILHIQYKGIFPAPALDSIWIYVFQFLINGYPEECFMRGYILPQLNAVLKNPVLSLWLTVILFDSMHIPQWIYGFHVRLMWWQWILEMMFPFQLTGWVYGVLYIRLRRVLPVAICHTYLTLWAFPFW